MLRKWFCIACCVGLIAAAGCAKKNVAPPPGPGGPKAPGTNTVTVPAFRVDWPTIEDTSPVTSAISPSPEVFSLKLLVITDIRPHIE